MNYLQKLYTALATMIDARFLALALPSFAYLYTDAAIANTIVYSFAAMIALAAISHIVRKIYFPYIDLEEYANSALRDARASGLVVLAVALVLSTIIISTTLWLKG